MSARPQPEPGLLVLADGAEFEGEAIGAFTDPEAELSVATGEFVFNTAMSGYQEVLTDPSYAGQVVTFTYPHIGNYGTNPADAESAAVHCAGIYDTHTVDSLPTGALQQVLNVNLLGSLHIARSAARLMEGREG